MKQGVRLVAIEKLRAHEKVSPQRLAVVMEEIKKQGRVVNPVVIDGRYMIILDGHHRVESLRRLGYQLAPVMEVDYFSNQVKVFSRRKMILISKKVVVSKVIDKQVFPSKTTRHLIRGRIRGVKIKLNRLK